MCHGCTGAVGDKYGVAQILCRRKYASVSSDHERSHMINNSTRTRTRRRSDGLSVERSSFRDCGAGGVHIQSSPTASGAPLPPPLAP